MFSPTSGLPWPACSAGPWRLPGRGRLGDPAGAKNQPRRPPRGPAEGLESLGFVREGDSKAAAWRVLRHSEFCRFFFASVVSNWGTWLQNTAQMLIAYRFTHSVLTVGLVTCAQFSTPLILRSMGRISR